MAKVLIIEDDQKLSDTIQNWLTRELYSVEVVANGLEGLSRLRNYDFDLVVLDWGLPEISGIEICRRYRSGGGQLPLLMLTGRSSIDEKESGFEAGVDDYLTKPFEMRELSARIKSLLRRSSKEWKEELLLGSMTLRRENSSVIGRSATVQLTRTEFRLLEFLCRYPGEVFSHDVLLNRVWSSESEATTTAVRACIKQLRQKLGKIGEGKVIKTFPGLGYTATLDP